jgi:hypothetical protein
VDLHVGPNTIEDGRDLDGLGMVRAVNISDFMAVSSDLPGLLFEVGMVDLGGYL